MRILVGDDQPDVREALRLLLKGAGHDTETVESPQALLDAVAARAFDLILMDLNYTRDTTSGQEGLELLDRLKGAEPPVVVMTAWGDVDLAVRAMQRGARDFVQKPWDNNRLLEIVRKEGEAGADRRRATLSARSELEVARDIQQRLFPRETPRLKTLELAGACRPAREIGGDYYDFIDVGAGAAVIVLADVSGKGVPAALLMANLQASFRSQATQARADMAGLLESINRLFYDATPPSQYATLFFATYEESSRRLRYVNCGHLAPMLLRAATGAVERLEANATVFGLFAAWQAREASVLLAPGDRLLAFSDGVTEAGLERGEDFGESPLERALRAGEQCAPSLLIAGLLTELRAWTGRAAQGDDMTLIAARAL